MGTPKGVADHPDRDLMESMWSEGLRAADIVKHLNSKGITAPKRETLARFGQRYWSTTRVTVEADMSDLGEVIETAQQHGTVKAVKSVQSEGTVWRKQDGEDVELPTSSTRHTIDFIPTLATESFEVEARPLNVYKPKVKSGTAKPAGYELVISLPDTQMGFFRGTDGTMHPIHDEAAIDVCMQIIAFLEQSEGVDVVVNQGDDLDFAEFSSHRSTPGYLNLLNENLSRHKSHHTQQRAITPDARIVQLFGNHEARIEKFIADKAPQLMGLTQVGSDEPVLSIPFLCGYDDNNIEYSHNYPQGVFWHNEFLKFVHGTATSGVPGGAAGKSIGQAPGVSVIYGHDHYQAVAYDRVRTATGMRTIVGASGGTLSRLDGMVPSTTGTIQPSGKMLANERWTQGMLVIYSEPDGECRHMVEPIIVNDGQAIFRGMEFSANVDVDGNDL